MSYYQSGGGGRNLNVGEIVTSIVPLNNAALHLLDGAKLSIDGTYKEGLEKIIETYDTIPNTSNIQKVGSLVDNNNVLSGFSVDNYAKLPYAFSPGNNTWEMVFKVTTGSDVTTVQEILATNTEPDAIAFVLKNSHFSFYASSDNVNFDIAVDVSGTYVVQANTTYYVKVGFSGSAYTVSYSLDGNTFTTDITVTSSVPVISGNLMRLGIGIAATDWNPFLGSIDLSASYININNTRWWSGTKRGIFTTEAEWQSCVNQHGVCGKFVYDDVNRTVRLPKVSGFIEGTLDSSTLGDLVEAGSPNISGNITTFSGNYAGPFYKTGCNGAFSATYTVTNRYAYDSSSPQSDAASSVNLNASRSSTIYGNSDTVQPQSIKVFYYIVLGTVTKTEIQVNIDNVLNDLALKADTDMDNLTATGKAALAHAAMPSERYIDLTLPASTGTVIAPDDGFMHLTFQDNVSSNATVSLVVHDTSVPRLSGHNYKTIYHSRCLTPNATSGIGVTIPVRKGVIVYVYYSGTADNKYFTFIYANGSVPN